MKTIFLSAFIFLSVQLLKAQTNTFSNLSLQRNASTIDLTWTMSCNTSEVTFTVERSFNEGNFTPVYTETVSRERCLFPFKVSDNQPANGLNTYRIRTANFDGTYTYSELSKIYVEGLSRSTKLFPQIVTSAVTVSYESAFAGKMNWLVSNSAGGLVKQVLVPVLKGTNLFTINLSSLPPGKYFIRGTSGSIRTETLSCSKM